MLERRRPGISKLVIPVVVVIIVAAFAGAYFLTRGPTTKTSSSSSSSSTSANTAQVQTNVNQLVQDINARNVDGLIAFYSSNSVLVWSGNVGGLAGMYTPVGNIRLIYATTVGKDISISANISNYGQTTESASVVNATYTMKLLANSTEAGIVHATIDITEQWTSAAGSWQITKENWAYTLFDSSFIDEKIPVATTFPQWGDQLAGGNPNLVPEKSFEWHIGPYVAASVYAFLFGVLAMAGVRIASRRPRAYAADKAARQRRDEP